LEKHSQAPFHQKRRRVERGKLFGEKYLQKKYGRGRKKERMLSVRGDKINIWGRKNKNSVVKPKGYLLRAGD